MNVSEVCKDGQLNGPTDIGDYIGPVRRSNTGLHYDDIIGSTVRSTGIKVVFLHSELKFGNFHLNSTEKSFFFVLFHAAGKLLTQSPLTPKIIEV